MGKRNKRNNVGQPQAQTPWGLLVVFLIVGICCGLLIAWFAMPNTQERTSSVSSSIAKETAAIQQIMEQAKLMEKSQPFAALELYSTLNEHEWTVKDKFAEALMQKGDFLQLMKMFHEAIAAHQKALDFFIDSKSSHTTEIILLHVSLATDLYKSRQFDAAMSQLDGLHSQLKGATLPPDGQSILLQVQSEIFFCKADYISAHVSYMKSQRLTGTQKAADPFEPFRREHDLLSKIIETTAEMPQDVKQSMSSRVKEIESILIDKGPWSNPLQLPQTYIEHLSSRPWHQVTNFLQPRANTLQRAISALTNTTRQLTAEYNKLERDGLLDVEVECIQHPDGGEWHNYEITGFWHKRKNGCSVSSPVSCDLVEELRRLGLPVIRAGYSAVGPNSYLQPHFGMTNGQLKFHLGLTIPTTSDGKPCAQFTVGGETKAWEEGGVLFFDDSFLHSVRNKCTQTRVVFQVVFVHPEVDQAWV